MTFTYEYRTADNARHTDVIDAPDREAAFRLLREKGIRPARLSEAPGFFNALFGKGKRWLAIGALALILVGVLVKAGADRRAARDEARFAAEDRAQLFGDPAVIQKLAHNGWRDTFPDEGDAFLARHAIPGKLCDCASPFSHSPSICSPRSQRLKTAHIPISPTDAPELAKMKRMVNGMKRELAAYVEKPGDDLEYAAKCCERCRIEKGVYDGIAHDLETLSNRLKSDPKADRAQILSEWDKKNAALRAMGLSTIPQPE